MLVSGDCFGEIGLLFNCTRTCTIVSTNYTILARLAKARLRMLISDFPIFKKILLKKVYTYNDDQKKFAYSAFQSIEYLKNISTELFHTLYFKMEE